VSKWHLSVFLPLLLAACDDEGAAAGGAAACSGGGCDASDGCDPAHPGEGCACESGEVAPCFDGEQSLIGVGGCRAGQRVCRDGRYGACEGQILPSAETCDGVDEDCNGLADDGLGAACLPCEGDCERVAFGGRGGGEGFVLGDESEGVKVDDDAVVLDATMVDVSFVWIANTEEGTVSKIEPRLGVEAGRYLSALPAAGLPPPLQRCSEERSEGNCPSRTAVDLLSDVWVANRAYGGQGSVTKILAAGCPDRNEDGVITTSHDEDGNGIIDLNDPVEFPGTEDECVVLTVAIGGRNARPRGLAVDPFFPEHFGSVWVGAYEEKKMFKLHGNDGSVLEEKDLPIHPYGAVMTADRHLWVTSLGGVDNAIVSIDSATNRVGEPIPIQSRVFCSGGYGIAVDAQARIWLGGWTCEAAFRYDPAAEPAAAWRTIDLTGRGYTRGITVDGNGRVWTAHSHEARLPFDSVGRVTSFDAETLGDRTDIELEEGLETIGVGVDADGRIWAVNLASDNAIRIDPETGDSMTVRVGAKPYTYSDFTGFGLRTFTAPFGRWVGTVDACEPSGEPQWDTLAWDADVPAGGSVTAWVRTSSRLELLASAPRVGPFTESPADLGAVPDVKRRRFMRIELELRTQDLEASPRVRAVQVQYHCPTG